MRMKPEIEIIEPTRTLKLEPIDQEPKKLRVAAYARVSTDQEEQQSSYEAQVDYYKRYISNNPDWKMVEVFADRGITGTSTKHRAGFNKMITLAKNGGIDLILTKSISRFARNTVDTLKTVRELKAAGVNVIFEKENLNTADPKCEMLLTIMSSLAQEESRNISENVRWGQKESRKKGNVNLPYKHFLGYRKGENGRPEVVEEEAETVRYIYRKYLEGKSLRYIADSLTAEGVKTPGEKDVWRISTVRSILSNEKYMGEALLQKTYTVDFLTKEVRKNQGEKSFIRVKNSHDAIIDPEDFAKVQILLEQQTKRRCKYVPKRVFSGKIICGECGSYYGHKVWRYPNTGERYDVWDCNHKYKKDTEKCETPALKEDELKEIFTRMLKKRRKRNTEFSEERWKEMVESVMVSTDGTLHFMLTDGSEVDIKR